MPRFVSRIFIPVFLFSMSWGGTSFGLDNGLARVPYMGWNTYYCWGWNDKWGLPQLKAHADALIATGLRDLGYRIVWLDAGWPGSHLPDGTIKPRFDMTEFCQYMHTNGLLAGIYTDTHPITKNFGSGGNEKADMDQFVKWGFDAVKVDSFGGGGKGQHEKFRDAIAGRMIYNICVPTAPNPSLDWAPTVGHSWRTGADIGPADWLQNFDANMARPELNKPGAYNDPDYLNGTLGEVDTRSQFSMWAMMSSPLILGFDVSKAKESLLDVYRNKEIIDLDQDPLCYQCRRVVIDGAREIYKKELSDGNIAVALFNRRDGFQGNTFESYLGICSFPAVTSKKVRILVTWTSGPRASSLVPAVYNDPSTNNLALGKKTKVTSEEEIKKGRYDCQEIDFKEDTTFNKVTFKQPKGRILGYRIQYWDGAYWLDAFVSNGPLDITVKWSDLGINGKFLVRDLWEHRDKGSFDSSYTAARVPMRGCTVIKIFVKLRPATAKP